ncbi:transcription-repair coupling factor [cyanobacterium endosymbiont of Epithemia turgida]|uniref:transcription-repair coupling factor n=1 Tax=cyanobacterium endosymbiont of Epithemia turgida TaxID=718217 RepID=UPI0004D177DA|nr:transcription-repair coupling factor [cyanobacterium endosymbiont of Epithemia turgida]BAP17023.1 transcription-repair coupling factor [cyanobacterium endosymbiont of Epithemia turgida isolate EtSB Lake Yunoko]
MTFSSLIRTLQKSPLTKELLEKLKKIGYLGLKGIPRFPKGLMVSALAQAENRSLLVVCATQEEAGRWATQLETMGWKTVDFYPTSEASPYELFNAESEMIWGQMQVLSSINSSSSIDNKLAIVTTEKVLQPHLPPPEIFWSYCLNLQTGITQSSQEINQSLTKLGYKRVSLVETEGQWSRRGDIVDIFPVSLELPIRLEWFGDKLEKIRELDLATQRSLEKLDQVLLTPTSFDPIIINTLNERHQSLKTYLSVEEIDALEDDNYPEGMGRFLGIAFEKPASLIDYLGDNTLCVFDELEQCESHSNRWLEYIEDNWQELELPLPKIHRSFQNSVNLARKLPIIYLSELSESTNITALDLSSRPIPSVPHQFSKLAEILRGKQEIYSGIYLNKYSTWLVSAQPSRTVSLLEEHDCPAQFIPNPRDYPGVEKYHTQGIAVALKYSGLAELKGFILPTFRVVVITDEEFFGQYVLSPTGYIRKRRRAASKRINLERLLPGDYVVHKSHGVGRFLKLESLATREYLVIQYHDGLLRIPADSVDSLSRYYQSENRSPELHKMTGKTWEKTKQRVRKTIKKLAVDLLNLYAKRSQQSGFIYPPDTPWQEELEGSFPYKPTPDQLQAVQDIKVDLESDRPMDRLVCGDVGFGKTEVAVRAIFKAITSGNKQVALLAPTTILTQQHYHTLKERFAPYPINIGLLNRFRTISEKKNIVQRLATGELDVVVGTHEILGKTIEFKNLGLLVIDEEQRFGVNQKEKIKKLKTQVDVLALSATPIPRTLYMSLSGIREMSLITTPPPSRRSIKTHLSSYNPDVIRTAIRNELDRGGQIFYVVSRIEGIEEVAGKLQQMISSARIMVAHGQMDVNELEITMLDFNNGIGDILVCTTIIESGLDIPRVNTIIIEDSQKFGLSQLYQLRGRVGRSGVQAHAWLLYPSRGELTETARKRLRALQELSQLGSGYQLATRDMEIRGVGNLLGAEQSGQMTAIGFELYMEMLQEAIKEIQGQEIPQVNETQVDLQLTAFIPNSYIADTQQKMDAYRAVATANSKKDLEQIMVAWTDCYGEIPTSVKQLLQVIELKQIGKSLGFSRIKTDDKQHIILETPMEEPAWKLLQENLPHYLQSRFVYSPKKVTVRGLGLSKPQKQLESLIEWLGKMKRALPQEEIEIAN